MRLLWIEFGALTLCVLLLVYRCGRRWERQRRIESQPPQRTGHGFDATPVKRRLAHLRQDYPALVVLPPRRTSSHDEFVAAVRRSLIKLSYFHSVRQTAEDTPDRHPEEDHA